jgi:alanyl-tRNA synthetase
VFEDREIRCYFIPEEKIESVPLRRPPKKKGLIRVVEVSDFDFSACDKNSQVGKNKEQYPV